MDEDWRGRADGDYLLCGGEGLGKTGKPPCSQKSEEEDQKEGRLVGGTIHQLPPHSGETRLVLPAMVGGSKQ